MELDNDNMPYYIIKDWIKYIAEKCDSVLDCKLSNGKTVYEQWLRLFYPKEKTRRGLYYELLEILVDASYEDIDLDDFLAFENKVETTGMSKDAIFGPTAEYIYNYGIYTIAIDRALKKLSATEHKALPFIALNYSFSNLTSGRYQLYNIILVDKQDNNIGLRCWVATRRFGQGAYQFYTGAYDLDQDYEFGDWDWWRNCEVELRYQHSDTSSQVITHTCKAQEIIQGFKDLWNKAEHYDITEWK